MQPEHFYDIKLDPISYKNGNNIIQFERRLISPDESQSEVKILTFLLNSENGKVTSIDRDLPIVKAFKNNNIATVDNNRIISRILELNYFLPLNCYKISSII